MLACLVVSAPAVAAAASAGAGSTGGSLAAAVYGRVLPDADGPPPVLNAQPVQVRATRTAAAPEPVYLYVPVAERRHWPQHCARHQACALPVYFVDGPRWARRLGAEAESGELPAGGAIGTGSEPAGAAE